MRKMTHEYGKNISLTLKRDTVRVFFIGNGALLCSAEVSGLQSLSHSLATALAGVCEGWALAGHYLSELDYR